MHFLCLELLRSNHKNIWSNLSPSLSKESNNPKAKKINALILLRGLPGSGKSTLAKLLSGSGNYPVFSIDQYFIDKDTGAYQFDYKKNFLAYQQCEDQTREAMGNQIKKIFVENTFTMAWEMEPYFKLASELNYRVFVLTVENHHGNNNTHRISKEQMEKMAAKYKVRLM